MMSAYGVSRNWWWIVLRGLFAVLFVLAAYFGTHATLVALVLLFGVHALVDGGLTVIAGLTRPMGSRPWWVWLMEGLTSLGAGVLSFLSPGLTAIALLYLIVAWAIVTGALEIYSFFRLRSAIEKVELLAVSGLLSVAVGVMLWAWPGETMHSVMWLMGAYALAFGLLQIGLGIRLRSLEGSARRMTLQPVSVEVEHHLDKPQRKQGAPL